MDKARTKMFGGMEFKDISMERNRSYCFHNGTTLVIQTPLWIHIKKADDGSVTQRIIAVDPDDGTEFLCFHLDMELATVISWIVSVDDEPFSF